MSWNVSAQINNLAAIVRTIQNTGLTNPLAQNINADGYSMQNASSLGGRRGYLLNINADSVLGVAVNAPITTGNYAIKTTTITGKAATPLTINADTTLGVVVNSPLDTGTYAITTPTITAPTGAPLTLDTNDVKGDGLIINSQTTITTAQTGDNTLIVANSGAPTNSFFIDNGGNVSIKGDPDAAPSGYDLNVDGAVNVSKNLIVGTSLSVGTSITADTINYTTLNPIPISNPSPLSATLDCANHLLTNVAAAGADATCAIPIGQTQIVPSFYGSLPFAGSGPISFDLPYGIGAFPTTTNTLTDYKIIFPQLIGIPTNGTPASWYATPDYVLPPAKLDFSFGFYVFPQDLTWATNVQGVMGCVTLVQGSLGSGDISSILGTAVVPFNYVSLGPATAGAQAITGHGTIFTGPMTLNANVSATNTAPIFIVQLYQANADFSLGADVAVSVSCSAGTSAPVPPQLIGGFCMTTILPNNGAGY